MESSRRSEPSANDADKRLHAALARRERRTKRVGKIGRPEPALFHRVLRLRDDAAGAIKRVADAAKLAREILGVILRCHGEAWFAVAHPRGALEPKIIAELERQRLGAAPVALGRGLSHVDVDHRSALLAKPITDAGAYARGIDVDGVGGELVPEHDGAAGRLHEIFFRADFDELHRWPATQNVNGSIVAIASDIDAKDAPLARRYDAVRAGERRLGVLKRDKHVVVLARKLAIRADPDDVRTLAKLANKPAAIGRIDKWTVPAPKMQGGKFGSVLLVGSGEVTRIAKRIARHDKTGAMGR
jgi:hypothetical protein